jgi:hypothetical protein
MFKPKKIVNDPKDAVDKFIAGLLLQFLNPLVKLQNHHVILMATLLLPIMNFGLACERANQEGILCQMVVVADDCALEQEKGITGCDNVCGHGRYCLGLDERYIRSFVGAHVPKDEFHFVPIQKYWICQDEQSLSGRLL